MKTLLFVILVPALFFSCLTNRINKTDIDTVEFGSGGGFSGLYSSYVIDLNKRVIRKDGSELRRLENKQLSRVLRQLESFDIYKIDFSRPYNFTYFIEVSGSKNNRIVWGLPSYRPPQEVICLYEILEELNN